MSTVIAFMNMNICPGQVAQVVGAPSRILKSCGFDSGQGVCGGCGFDPLLGHIWGQIDVSLSHQCFLSLSLSLPPSLSKINKHIFRWGFRENTWTSDMCVAPIVCEDTAKYAHCFSQIWGHKGNVIYFLISLVSFQNFFFHWENNVGQSCQDKRRRKTCVARSLGFVPGSSSLLAQVKAREHLPRVTRTLCLEA